MSDYIDLHVHSNYSDGTCSPAELVMLAKRSGLRAFALTDHDTTAGVDEALAAGKEEGVEVIPGIEFSTSYEGRDVHVLGLGIDHRDARFQEALLGFRGSRAERNERMIRLMQEHGVDISMEELHRLYPDSAVVLTRAHFARFLFENGYVASRDEAFERYLGEGACCYVPRRKVTPFAVISAVHEAGGRAVLAHPLLYKLSPEELELLVSRCKKAGMDGLEAIYSRNRRGDEASMRLLAKKYNLKITGGSDFHGDNKPDIALGTGRGDLRIPYEVWRNLK